MVILLMDNKNINKYLERLIPKLFKLMPLKENEDPNYDIYLDKLIIQIIGFKNIDIYIYKCPFILDIICNLSGLCSCDCDIRIHNSIIKECINMCKREMDGDRYGL